MAEYINKEKALYEMWQNLYKLEDEEKKYGINACERYDIQSGFKAGLKVVANMPTIDIVCCSECRWWKRKEDTKYGFCHNCQHGYLSDRWDISIDRKTKENHYCADAIRKE